MNSDKVEKMFLELEGKSGATITNMLAKFLGEDGMANNLMKMYHDLKLEKEVATKAARSQGVLTGATIGAIVTSALFSGGIYIYNKSQEKNTRKLTENKEVTREKQLEKYKEEMLELKEAYLYESTEGKE